MIKLRALEPKDAPYMLEWMHDPDIQKGFKRNMLDASMDDVITFVSPQTCVPEIKESPHFCRDSDYISDYCTLKI